MTIHPRSHLIRALRVTAWLACQICALNAALGGQVYWSEVGPDLIVRANDDGSNLEVLVTVPNQPSCLSTDGNGKMYWSDNRTGLYRANLDGSQVESIVPGHSARTLSVDRIRAKLLFFVTSNPLVPASLFQADLNGSNVERLFAVPNDGINDMELDPIAGKLYWSGEGPNNYRQIRRANYDGTDIEVLFAGKRFSSLVLDPVESKLYWTTDDTGNRRIERGNLNGSPIETLLTQSDMLHGETFLPEELAIDFVNRKLYWSSSTFTNGFFRANLDGSEYERAFSEGISDPTGFFVVSEPSSRAMLLLALSGILSSTCIGRVPKWRREQFSKGVYQEASE
jgi:hypothetical protein